MCYTIVMRWYDSLLVIGVLFQTKEAHGKLVTNRALLRRNNYNSLEIWWLCLYQVTLGYIECRGKSLSVSVSHRSVCSYIWWPLVILYLWWPNDCSSSLECLEKICHVTFSDFLCLDLASVSVLSTMCIFSLSLLSFWYLILWVFHGFIFLFQYSHITIIVFWFKVKVLYKDKEVKWSH